MLPQWGAGTLVTLITGDCDAEYARRWNSRAQRRRGVRRMSGMAQAAAIDGSYPYSIMICLSS